MRACFEYEMVHVLFLSSWSDVGFFFFFNWQMRKEINECEVRVTSTIVTVLAATLPMFLRFPLCTFSDCSFCIFFLSLPAFCFWLCIPEFSGLLTLLCVMDNLLSCHPLNTCSQPLSFENVIGFCSLFNQIF